MSRMRHLALVAALLHPVLYLITAPVSSADHTFHVTAGDNSSCPVQECHNLSYYLQNARQTFISNTTVVFLQGTHLVEAEGTIMIENVTNLRLVGSHSHSHPPNQQFHKILCLSSAAFAFQKGRNISIDNLVFSNCGIVVAGHPAALYFDQVVGLSISQVIVENSSGYGLHVTDHLGNASIISSTFQFNSAAATEGGNVYFQFARAQCNTSNTEVLSLTITDSQFLFGVGNPNVSIGQLAGGLHIDLPNSCPCVLVNITDTVAKNNSGIYGNMAVVVSEYVASSICTFINIDHSYNAYAQYNISEALSGGLILVLGRQVSCSNARKDEQHTIMHISNTQFVGSYSVFGGSGLELFYFQKCFNTRVLLTNVTFYGNIKLLPQIFCGGNMLIADFSDLGVNNSVLLDECTISNGKTETVGGGLCFTHNLFIGEILTPNGGSETTSPHGFDLQVSNSQVIGNYATRNGGGFFIETYFGVTVSLTNVSFDGNIAETFGGSVYIDAVTTLHTLQIVNSLFRSSVAQEGAAVYISGSKGYYTFKANEARIQNSTFQNQTGNALFLYQVKHAIIEDCYFCENNGTALSASASNILMAGTNKFEKNQATNGGGLTLCGNSVLFLSNNELQPTHVQFINNHAFHTGGAIYVEDQCGNSNPSCFFQFNAVSILIALSEIHSTVTFENNTADSAGGAIYGGSVDSCQLHPQVFSRVNQQLIPNGVVFNHIFKSQHSDELNISSDPVGVCLCNNHELDCDIKSFHTEPIFPGESFTVEIATVGQRSGPVPGVLLAEVTNTENASLSPFQRAQSISRLCTPANFTVFSSEASDVTIMLTPEQPSSDDTRVTGFLPPQLVVSLLPCPLGFELTGIQPHCDCVDKFLENRIRCNLSDQTVHRQSNMWIGYYQPDASSSTPDTTNGGVAGVLIHHHCPFDYCKPTDSDIDLNDPDKQCAFSRSGILCGGCKQNFSLVLGTSQCLQCQNTYILLLAIFVLAGVALVFILTVGNITVAAGTINGLIFYANLIQVNRSTFFPPGHKNVLTVFIAWLNLDLGIQTCFFNNIDAYVRTWLQFVFPIYIWVIVILMILVSHYSTLAAKVVSRDVVKVLATLFLLSYAKLFRTIIDAFSSTNLKYPDGSTYTVWLLDGNVAYFSGKHLALFLAALVALLGFIMPYTLVILFAQCLQSRSRHRILHWVSKFQPLFDAYTGPYKDKYRFWTGLFLLSRVVLFVIFATSTLGDPIANLISLALVTTCLLVLHPPRVYKVWLLGVLELSFLLNLNVLSILVSYIRYTGDNRDAQSAIVYTSVSIAFVTFIGIVLYHAYSRLATTKVWKKVFVFQKSETKELSDTNEHELSGFQKSQSNSVSFIPYREPLLEDSEDI